MALPLLWLGAGALALLATKEYSNETRIKSRIALMPSEGKQSVIPVDGAIVSCGIYGLFEHTGIWLDGNIIELKGNGLIRGISTKRFLQNRSGEFIYIACDQAEQPLVAELAAKRATEQLFQYSEYHLFKNNCHKFVWQCISGEKQQLTRFSDLNSKMAAFFNSSIHWQKALV